MNVVFASAEVSPIAKTGGLGDVAGSLPKALAKLGHDVVVFMPFYRQARQWFDKSGASIYQALPTTNISWANWSADATYLRATLPGSDVPLILIANDYFFDRHQIYAAREDGFDDYFHRYVFFCRAVIRGCELLGIEPDIVHAHDWHTSLLPVYLDSGLRGGSPSFHKSRSVYTIHNLNYQGNAARDAFYVAGLHDRYWAPDALEHFGQLNPMKGGILFADQVTTVSPSYAREIQTSLYGAGLDGVLRAIGPKLHGILNGIDVEEWDPATDPLLPKHYDADSLDDKFALKKALVTEAGLKYKAKTPVFGVISRLVAQKGFQLLIPILERLLGTGAQAVILGSGEPEYERAFEQIAERNPASCKVWIGFDNALAHRIYAGADLLLMPSVYEPCGLNQMYALRYGTIPVVRMTGGLADTVIPFDGTNESEANGFGFMASHPLDLYLASWLAVLNYRTPKMWKRLQTNGMRADLSWDRSAREYVSVYERAARA